MMRNMSSMDLVEGTFTGPPIFCDRIYGFRFRQSTHMGLKSKRGVELKPCHNVHQFSLWCCAFWFLGLDMISEGLLVCLFSDSVTSLGLGSTLH